MSEQRSVTIDAFRGFAVFCLVIGNFISAFVWVPVWLKHAPDIGFTIIDLGAPAFIFVIGLNYVTSFQRRFSKEGAGATFQHFLVRYFAILGLGSLFGAGQVLFQINSIVVNWGVLQAIGVAGILTLVVIRLPTWQRLLICLGLLTGYQLLLDRFWLGIVLTSPHGGLLGSLAWTALLILSTVLADLFYRDDRGFIRLLAAASLSILLALLLSLWFPISKNRVSETYILLSLGLSGWFYCLFYVLVERFKWNLNLFVSWGRNPLLLYVLHLLLQGLLTLPFQSTWSTLAPIWVVIIQVTLLLSLLTLIARFLDQKKYYFVL